MGFLSAIRVALEALLVNKVRTALTSLGIVIGTGAVIALVSAGEGARSKLDDMLESLGKTIILIRSVCIARSAQPQARPLTSADVDAVRKQAAPYVTGVAALQYTQRVASSRTASWSMSVVGTTPDLQEVRKWKMAYGRFLVDDDLKKDAAICLLGDTVRRRLFPNDPNPVGQWIRMDYLRLRIVGILDSKGRSLTGSDQDDQILMPLTTLQHKLEGKENLSMIVASARSEDMIERARQEIEQIMRGRHRVKPGAEDFDVSTVQEMVQLAVVVTHTMQLLVAVIASISLVVGGIGIMNIMLVSVVERTHEIGLRMAVGATPQDVLVQFLLEAVTLTLLGGTLGATLGIGAAMMLARLASWPLIISPFMVLLAFILSAGVGIFFGFYPAWKASQLEPIDALRHE